MDTKRRVVGSHAFFVPVGMIIIPADGEVPAVLAGRTAKPTDEFAGWIDLGIADWAKANTATFETLMAPSPGLRQAYDEIQTSGGLTLTGTLKEMSNLVMQLILSTAALAASPAAGGAYNPLGGAAKVNGWLKLDQYDQNNELFNELRVFVSLKPTSPLPNGDAPNDVTADALVLYSTLNEGTLA